MLEIYNKLYSRYGDLNWWPPETPYEMMVGAVLTQNTAWSNVEKALANFGDNLTPEFVENAEINDLIELIRPSGFFNQKAKYLKSLTAWYKLYDYSPDKVKLRTLDDLRKELLSINGIGFETADSIMLYAFEYPTFVIDAYTTRLIVRLGIHIKTDYHSIKSHFESTLECDVGLYKNFHALIVINAKEHCRKKPKCDNCPLMRIC